MVAHVPLVDERLRILTGAEQRTILRLLRLRESNPAVSVFANSDDVWLVAWLTVILRKPLAGSLFSAAAAAPTARHLRYHRLLHSSFYPPSLPLLHWLEHPVLSVRCFLFIFLWYLPAVVFVPGCSSSEPPLQCTVTSQLGFVYLIPDLHSS